MTEAIDVSRRRFFTASVKKSSPTTLRLPWSQGEDVFTSQCTQCQKCVDACETQIIKRDRQGFPYIDFSQDECTFCQQCVDVCEVPMFTDPSTTKAWDAEVIIGENCLTKHQIYCQSCRDACDANVISFPIKLNQTPQPTIEQSDCTACGACVSTCPQDVIKISLINQDKL